MSLLVMPTIAMAARRAALEIRGAIGSKTVDCAAREIRTKSPGDTRVHEDVFDRSIDVQVLRLRRKLEIDPSSPRIIRTVRRIGYEFDLPVEAA